MSSQQVFSAHPALAVEQLQRAEQLEASGKSHQLPQSTSNSNTGTSRRHYAKTMPKKYAISRTCAAAAAQTHQQHKTQLSSTTIPAFNSKTQPVRTKSYAAVDDDDDIEGDDVDDVNFAATTTTTTATTTIATTATTTPAAAATTPATRLATEKTKDCVDQSFDEVDHVQQRHKRHQTTTRLTHQLEGGGAEGGGGGGGVGGGGGGGDVSDHSSVLSSPSASTVSSPLSTPTRLPPMQQLQHCCQKSATAGANCESRARQHHPHHHHHQPHHQQQHHHHHHHQQQHHHTNTACVGSGGGGGGGADGGSTGGCKANKKLDSRPSPSPYRQLLPIALCLLSFAAVFATLIVYMDTTEIRHQQFRLNMSRDYELNSVAQDDPALIAFLRQIHMRNNLGKTLAQKTMPSALAVPDSSGRPAGTGSLKFGGSASANSSSNGADQLAHYVADLVGGKLNGAVIQSLSGPLAKLITAPYLSDHLDWTGILVEPEPRWFFTLRKQNAQRARMQVVHACVSPNTYPKEIPIHSEDVRINSLHDGAISWFNSRVKCFPLYTIMLACERTEYDLLSLGVQGHELEILQTLPFDKVQIDIISIHLLEDHEDVHDYVQSITKFLAGKSYKMQRKIGRNYFYQRLNSNTSRTRKKDILLLKTP